MGRGPSGLPVCPARAPLFKPRAFRFGQLPLAVQRRRCLGAPILMVELFRAGREIWKDPMGGGRIWCPGTGYRAAGCLYPIAPYIACESAEGPLDGASAWAPEGGPPVPGGEPGARGRTYSGQAPYRGGDRGLGHPFSGLCSSFCFHTIPYHICLLITDINQLYRAFKNIFL